MPYSPFMEMEHLLLSFNWKNAQFQTNVISYSIFVLAQTFTEIELKKKIWTEWYGFVCFLFFSSKMNGFKCIFLDITTNTKKIFNFKLKFIWNMKNVPAFRWSHKWKIALQSANIRMAMLWMIAQMSTIEFESCILDEVIWLGELHETVARNQHWMYWPAYRN